MIEDLKLVLNEDSQDRKSYEVYTANNVHLGIVWRLQHGRFWHWNSWNDRHSKIEFDTRVAAVTDLLNTVNPGKKTRPKSVNPESKIDLPWIPITERLPKEGSLVVLGDSRTGTFRCGRLNPDKDWLTVLGRFHLHSFTHWVPVPDLPREKPGLGLSKGSES